MATADSVPQPPADVRIVRVGGSVIPCEVRRDDPPWDGDGCAAWVAVPVGEPVRMRSGDRIRAAFLPAYTALRVQFAPET